MIKRDDKSGGLVATWPSDAEETDAELVPELKQWAKDHIRWPVTLTAYGKPDGIKLVAPPFVAMLDEEGERIHLFTNSAPLVGQEDAPQEDAGQYVEKMSGMISDLLINAIGDGGVPSDSLVAVSEQADAHRGIRNVDDKLYVFPTLSKGRDMAKIEAKLKAVVADPGIAVGKAAKISLPHDSADAMDGLDPSIDPELARLAYTKTSEYAAENKIPTDRRKL